MDLLFFAGRPELKIRCEQWFSEWSAKRFFAGFLGRAPLTLYEQWTKILCHNPVTVKFIQTIWFYR